MKKKAKPVSKDPIAPLTFDAPESLLDKVSAIAAKKGCSNSEVIRVALDKFDLAGFAPEVQEHRQISFRLPGKKKKELLNASRKKKVSVGEIVRAAIEALG